ncbi:hypothetical protein NDU88_003629 [Pleurodeles waltl]|uniref:Uncharacterized protein n=1 Tax=Pleurodeles waltl TaxID=8319 RepID=A0AAV7KZ17_PLEWA|nr:hypothetical protein NDU88_003629 [Pleurodeles waltl]
MKASSAQGNIQAHNLGSSTPDPHPPGVEEDLGLEGSARPLGARHQLACNTVDAASQNVDTDTTVCRDPHRPTRAHIQGEQIHVPPLPPLHQRQDLRSKGKHIEESHIGCTARETRRLGKQWGAWTPLAHGGKNDWIAPPP